MNDPKPNQLTWDTYLKTLMPFDCPIKNLTFFPLRLYNPAIQDPQWHIEFYSSMTSLLT
jgi:hypothetical protein